MTCDIGDEFRHRYSLNDEMVARALWIDRVNNEPRVYFIECPAARAVKIGYAKDPERRMGILQSGCPFELRMLAFGWGDVGTERELHQKFRRYLIRGEWFRLEGEVEDFVLQVMSKLEPSVEP